MKDKITLNVPEKFRGESYNYIEYNGPWIEEYFYKYWQKMQKRDIKRIYIPIFWTNYYHKHGLDKKHDKVQEFIDKNIESDKKYFTIVQDGDGIREKIPPNVLVFGAGGRGDIPIPLIKEIKPKNKKKDILCSFMGLLEWSSNRTRVRSKMFNALKDKKGFYFNYGDIKDFVDITSRSVFTLCPRGYGRTSFRLYESMALGSIPIYIWDDIEWLPYKDKLDWNEFSISINIKEIDKLPEIIKNHNTEIIKKKQKKLKEVYDKYFTLKGTSEQIIKMLKINQYEHLKINDKIPLYWKQKFWFTKIYDKIYRILDRKIGIGIFLKNNFPRLFVFLKKIQKKIY